jgi:hypothetical protein
MSEPLPPPAAPQQPLDEETRKRALANAVQGELLHGGRLESQTAFAAVLVFGKPVNHVLHAILTIFTCLLWGVVWIILSMSGGEKKIVISVDEYGNMWRKNL